MLLAWQRNPGVAWHLVHWVIAGMLLLHGGALLLELLQATGHAPLLANYFGGQGSINGFFQRFLLRGAITARDLLMILALLQIAMGLLLAMGVMTSVVLWGILLQSLLTVTALPVMTVPGVELEVMTYTSPALLVQSGQVSFMLMVAGLLWLNAYDDQREIIPWRALMVGALVYPLFVGAVFNGMAKIESLSAPSWLLLVTGLLLLSGRVFWFRLGCVLCLVLLLRYAYMKLSHTELDGMQQLMWFSAELPILVLCCVMLIYPAKDTETAVSP